ncbi:3797_t:CDS:2, partial [Acaulospora colombiana]
VCLCAIVIKSPGCSLAQSSLNEIDRLKDIFARVKAYRSTIIKLTEQAHLAMSQFKEGKWPPVHQGDDVDVDVMKFIGRTDFAPRKPQEATTPSTVNGHSEDLQPSSVHPVLFEYMKQFEEPLTKNGSPTSAFSTQVSTLDFHPEQSIFPPVIPGLTANTDIFTSGDSFDDTSPLGSRPEPSNFMGWASSGPYEGPSLVSASLQGDAFDVSQPFQFDDLFPDSEAGTDPNSKRQSQDQLRFLSVDENRGTSANHSADRIGRVLALYLQPSVLCLQHQPLPIFVHGTLAPGKGSSNTQELHDKIDALQARIKELETALAQLQSKVASEPHPLLAQSLKTATEGLPPEDDTARDDGSDNEDLVDTFGSLTIDQEGKTRKEDDQNADNDPGLPVDILLLSKFFPSKDVYEAEDVIRDLVKSYLPPKDVAYESAFSLKYQQKSLSTFSIMSNDPNGPNRAWGALSLAIRLAQMVLCNLNLIDRDNEHWDKYPEQAELRRRLWWDLVSCETVFGFAMGRPRAIYPAHYDTKMPKDDEDEGKTPS